MANEFCRYHPLNQASWRCTTCQTNLCEECVQPATEVDAMPLCLLCNQQVVALQQPEVIVPFWLQYTNFMRLPLGLLGWFAVLILFIVPVFLPTNLSYFITFMAYLFAGIYGWSLLQQAATGQLKDVTPQVFITHFNKLAINLAFVIAALFTALDFLAIKAAGITFMIQMLLACVLPAMLMGVVVDKNISAFFNVDSIRQVFSGLRFFYVPVVGASVVIWASSTAIVHLLADVLSPNTALGLKLALSSYGLWVMMSVVGYILFQFHQLFGFELANQPKAKKRSSNIKTDKQKARLDVYLKEGAYDKAASLLKTLSEKQVNNVDLQAQYYQLLVFMKDKEGIAYQAGNYINALLKNGNVKEALQVFAKVKKITPEFQPQGPDMSFELAKGFMENQNYQQVEALLGNLHKEHPHYPALPEAYLLLARVLYEKLNKQQQALEVMEYLVTRFQSHPRFALMDKVWRALGGKPKQDFMVD